MELLGSAGMTEFYQCRSCRHVVVVQGRRSWMLKPASRWTTTRNHPSAHAVPTA